MRNKFKNRKITYKIPKRENIKTPAKSGPYHQFFPVGPGRLVDHMLPGSTHRPGWDGLLTNTVVRAARAHSRLLLDPDHDRVSQLLWDFQKLLLSMRLRHWELLSGLPGRWRLCSYFLKMAIFFFISLSLLDSWLHDSCMVSMRGGSLGKQVK